MAIQSNNLMSSLLSRELIFTIGFSAIASLVSDFLQPLGNITFYLFLFSVLSVVVIGFLYFTKKIYRGKLFKFFLASVVIMFISGFLYSSQDDLNTDNGVLASNVSQIKNLQSTLGIIKKDLSEIRESTVKIEQLVGTVAENTQENIKQTKELNNAVKNSSELIASKLDEINDSFKQTSKLGGIIADPIKPEEFYNNAREYETRGDYLNARRMYNQYFTFKLDYIDPHLRYQTFLKVQEGRSGAIEIYNYLYENNPNIIVEFSRILLFQSTKRIQLLEQFLEKNKDFAPVYYELSKEYSKSRLGSQTLSEQKKESQYLELFLELHNQGKFLRYFIDNELASSWINDSRERLKLLEKLSSKIESSRVTHNYMASNRDFTINLGFKEDVKEIFYKTSKELEYKSTGLDSWIDSKTGELAIKKWINLPLKTTEEIISIKYLDIKDVMQGPFQINFNARDAFVEHAKGTLDRTKSSWVNFYRQSAAWFEQGERLKLSDLKVISEGGIEYFEIPNYRHDTRNKLTFTKYPLKSTIKDFNYYYANEVKGWAMGKDYTSAELAAIEYSITYEEEEQWENIMEGFPHIIKANEGIEYGEIQQQLPNQEINIIKAPREFIADKGEDIINFNYLPLIYMGKHETHKRSVIKREFYYLFTNHLQSHTCGISEIKISYNNNSDKIIKLQKCDPRKPYSVREKLREQYESMSDDKFAPCTISSLDSSSFGSRLPGSCEKTTNLTILDLPIYTKHVTIKIKFIDGEEMIQKFSTEDHCSNCYLF